MLQINETARLKLNQADPGAGHPDAGLLAAFVEQQLPESRREYLLGHLAACASCREVLVLISSEAATMEVIRPVAASPWWRQWHSMRWAGLAAAVAVIASVTWVGRPDPSTGFSQSANVFRQEVREAVATQPSASTGAATVAAVPERSPAKPVFETQAIHSRAGAGVSEPVQSSRSNAGAEALSLALAARNRHSGQIIEAPPPETARKTQPSNVSNANSMWATGIMVPAPASRVNASPESMLRVSPDSHLQFSSDSGQSWQEVLLPAGTRLRTVGLAGGSLWVAGTSGDLYRSLDAGRSWTRIFPSSRGVQLSGNVVAIEFSDAQHGTVLTSSGVKWTTGDGGLSWRMQ